MFGFCLQEIEKEDTDIENAGTDEYTPCLEDDFEVCITVKIFLSLKIICS